jgi:hypothetical protein
MKIGWNTYEDHRGHRGAHGGCFRCHDADMVDAEGRAIRSDCTLCHSILAQRSEHPFQFLRRPEPASPDATQHEYLGGSSSGDCGRGTGAPSDPRSGPTRIRRSRAQASPATRHMTSGSMRGARSPYRSMRSIFLSRCSPNRRS